MIDRVNKSILRALEMNGRISFNALSEKVNLSKTPCWTRVQSLENEKIIAGYRAVIAPEKIGLELQAFVQVRVSAERQNKFEEAVLLNGSILECFAMTGEADYLLRVVVENVNALDTLVRSRVATIPGVKGVLTVVVLKTIKENGLITDAL